MRVQKSLGRALKDTALLPAVDDIDTDIRNREGALFVYDMISMSDAERKSVSVGNEMSVKIGLNKCGYLRGVITADYKFARYFSPIRFNPP